MMLVNTDCVYKVGEGRLVHDAGGFHLTGCEGRLDYIQKPAASYSLYSDYFWYELGDMICIGGAKALYYCFPETGCPVAKTRLAAEELYKLTRAGLRAKSAAANKKRFAPKKRTANYCINNNESFAGSLRGLFPKAPSTYPRTPRPIRRSV